MRRFVFVGERRSPRAIKMGVRWQDGRLAAKQLFDALKAIDIDPSEHEFYNWFERGMPTLIVARFGQGFEIVALGEKVAIELRRRGVGHLKLVHPAARGGIRKKERYIEHVRRALA